MYYCGEWGERIMFWAIQNNQRVTATPNQEATCPICNGEVKSKCGTIKVWHWSHVSTEDCDSWSEGETEWHLKWKNEFPKEQQEIIMGKHRADIKLPSGKVIELQNSPISSEDIIERERFYENMIWLINGETFAKNLVLKNKLNYYSFIWKWFPKSLKNINTPLFIDMNFLSDYYQKEFEKIENKSDNEDYEVIGKTTVWEEYGDGNSYPHTEYIPYYKNYGDTKKELVKKMLEFDNAIFSIKTKFEKPSPTGWGIMMTKEEFLKQFR